MNNGIIYLTRLLEAPLRLNSSSGTIIKKRSYIPTKEREFDKNGNPIKWTAKGKRKSKRRKR
jgi:hypothetical protein